MPPDTSIAVPQPPDSPELGVGALNLLVLLAERRLFLAGCLLLSFLAGLALCLLLPPFYVATTRFYPPQQSSSSASSMLAQLGGIGALAGLSGAGGVKSPMDLYVGLLQTDTVENAMVMRFGLMRQYHAHRLSAARVMLEEHTKIDAKEKDGLVRLSVQDRSPARAAELANGYVEQLRKMSGSLAVSEASQRRLFLEQQLEQSKDKLAAAEEALRATENKTGVIQVDAQARSLIESAASLRGQIAAKQVQVESMRTYAGEGNADLLEVEQELIGLRAQLVKLNSQDSGSSSGLNQEKGQITGSGLEYVRRLREVKYQETMFEILARQYEAAKLDEAREGALIQVVDPAVAPDHRSGPKRLLIMAACLCLGLILSIGYVLLEKAFSLAAVLPQYRTPLLHLKRILGVGGRRSA
jgi:uncharacterized protein involved in exopolysaccharide biosynthesis